MDKFVFVFAITAVVLQSDVRCEECIDDIKVNCEMMASVFSICTVNKEKAAQLCPKTCNLCHPDGNWADWSSWSGCFVTCGSSLQTRKRTCTNPSQPNNGTSCKGASEEYKSCLNEPCPVPVSWGQWSEWGTCSSTCDAGIQHRDRVCNKPFSLRNDDQCVGVSTEEHICVQRACTDGRWTRWSTWSTCSVTCGGGVHRRTRDCTEPPPSAYGRYCTGLNNEVSTCNAQLCPKTDGGWTLWSTWSTCSVTCGGGIYQRTRDCANPPPSAYGRYCPGPNSDVSTCNTQFCPQTDGGWTLWSTWSTCSVTCGGGIYQRTRDCANPPPSAYGRYCPGPNSDVSTCNTQFCPQTAGGWSGWSSWSTCTSSCGGGVHQRHRGCTNPAPSPYGQPCYGLNADVMTCNKHKCASDRVMSAFTAKGISGDGNPLIFPTVELNLGNDYNSATGVFRCRVPGLYFFSVSVQKLRESDRTIDQILVHIQKNWSNCVSARSDPYDDVTDIGSYMIGTSCTVHLQRDDTILIFGTPAETFNGIYCSFTGFLISADIL